MKVLGIHMEHGRGGDVARAQLAIDRGLKSGRVDFIDMDESELLKLAEDALKCARILRGAR